MNRAPHDPRTRRLALSFGLLLAAPLAAPLAAQDADFEPIRFGDPDALAYAEEFFPGTTYDAGITTPDAVLGQPLGSRLAHPAEILDCFRLWAEESPRVSLEPYALSFEGRELVRVVVTSEANQGRLDEILEGIGRLADPRGLSAGDADRLLRQSPAVAWLGYSIHGDELSGADASMAVGYHLVAGTSANVTELLDELVVVIDPVMNPDGRERIITQIEQTFGYVPNLDYGSMQRGRWPWGRGNHYLFDMNRDWIAGIAPETRGRWRAIRSFHPQLMVDAHEMGGLDTYLFYPQAKAHNPHLPSQLDRWHQAFAGDQGRAFDRYGWGYYTREWADGWAPFYSDAWGSLSGAIGILYEQASTDGQPLKRASGEVVTYRESVHHHAVSSLANLGTLRANREAILKDFLEGKRRNVAADTPGNERSFVVVPGAHPDREAYLLENLLGQGLEVFRAEEGFTGAAVLDAWGEEADEREFPAGTLVVPARQPLSPLVRSYLDFDARMDDEDLLEERRELERHGSSKIYDNTAWNLGHALDLEAFWCVADGAELTPLEGVPAPTPGWLIPSGSEEEAYAWVVDGSRDAAVAFAARAMEAGVQVHLADREFTTGGRTFPRGSLLIRRHENQEGIEARVEAAARSAGVRAWPTSSGRSTDDGPDLGGGHFSLLERPRIAVLSNTPIATDTFGHLWHKLDVELGVAYSLIDAQSLGGIDLRRYNVLILPPSWGGLGRILNDHASSLRAWILSGGTLIAVDNSSAAVIDSELNLSAVVLRRDALDELDAYAFAADREARARTVEIDPGDVWEATPTPVEDEAEDAPEEEDSRDAADSAELDPDAASQDRWMQRFSPAGVFLRGIVDDEHWITAGFGAETPVYYGGSRVFLGKGSVDVAVRFAEEERLRLSGLLWPEARERIARSAYLTVERAGNGQVILFASVPGYRGYMKSGGRLFLNAVVYGPGAGANPPIPW